MFVPVIFANGEDDDLPGLIAAIQDEAVQVGDVIVQPGDPIVLVGVHLRICAGQIIITDSSGVHPLPDFQFPGPVVHVASRLGPRHLTVRGCEMTFGVAP